MFVNCPIIGYSFVKKTKHENTRRLGNFIAFSLIETTHPF